MSLAKAFMQNIWQQTCRAFVPSPLQANPKDVALCENLLRKLGDGCVYCGEKATTRDHFHALVSSNGMPSGHCSDLWNIVPSCVSCNSCKSNRHWRKFMFSTTPRSPRKRGVKDWRQRVNLLQQFEDEGKKRAQMWNVKSAMQVIQSLKVNVQKVSAEHAGAVIDIAGEKAKPSAPSAQRSKTCKAIIRPGTHFPTIEACVLARLHASVSAAVCVSRRQCSLLLKDKQKVADGGSTIMFELTKEEFREFGVILRQSRQPVRLIRHCSLQSPWSPKRGCQYAGLYQLTSFRGRRLYLTAIKA